MSNKSLDDLYPKILVAAPCHKIAASIYIKMLK